jgi:hypothetical protein
VDSVKHPPRLKPKLLAALDGPGEPGPLSKTGKDRSEEARRGKICSGRSKTGKSVPKRAGDGERFVPKRGKTGEERSENSTTIRFLLKKQVGEIDFSKMGGRKIYFESLENE